MAAPPGVLQELDSLLQSLQGLKPPGVNKTKVESITKICTSPDNISVCDRLSLSRNKADHFYQKQVSIVDVIVKNFNRTPPTHKLGVMYIVDSVTRQWKAAGTTWTAGINKMTDVFPGLMDNLIPTAPETQKEKISKLLDIWISSKTFPDHLLTRYKSGLNAPTQSKPLTGQDVTTKFRDDALTSFPAASSAPTSSTQGLPQNASSNGQYTQQAPNGTNGAATQSSTPAGGALFAALGNVQQPGLPLQMPGAQNSSAVIPPPVNAFVPAAPGSAAQAPASNQNAFASLLNAGTSATASTNLASQLQILQELAPRISPEQLAGVIKALGIPLPPLNPQSGAVPPPPFPSTSAPPPVPAQMPTTETSNQFRGGNDDRSRARSRSPDYNRGRYSPPNRRDSPTYGPYDPSAANNSSSQADHDRRGRGKGRGYRNEYRQRTPPPIPRDRPVSPSGAAPSNMPKPIAYDAKIPNGKIKGTFVFNSLCMNSS
jgi:protein NRD1